jgi:branched-chain amino acid transport system permease protein
MVIFIYGIINSLILALMAVGFTLVYGVSRLPNFAHGALYILTGFITWVFFNSLGLNYAVSIVLSIIVTALVGAVIYRFILIRVRGMEASEIIATFALGLAIMEGLRFAGFAGRTTAIPVFIDRVVHIFGVPVDVQRLIIVGVALLVLALLWFFTHYTKMGLALRAIAQHERAAMMLGIDSDLTAVISLALGSALAGLAAVVILPMGLITVETGYDVLTYAIAVCIIGGLGSWTGAVIGAFVLGFAQILTSAFIGPQWQMVVIFAAIILVLLFRPSGLFGRQKELEERV